MTRPAPTALASSVRDRLKDLADRRREDFQDVLLRFATERLLYRLSRSEWRDRFVLKGAMLFAIWADRPHRTTRDADFLVYGEITVVEMERMFRALCTATVEPDGLVFRPASVTGERIRAGRTYAGVHIRLEAELARAVILLQVDIATGDRVVPAPKLEAMPTLLDMPAPNLRVYSRYSVVAEKFQILAEMGLATSRMKDFLDLAYLCSTFEFDGTTLVRAIQATFAGRETAFPTGVPEALGDELAASAEKRAQWRAFVRRSRLVEGAPELATMISSLRGFLFPPLTAARSGTRFEQHWFPDKGWQAKK